MMKRFVDKCIEIVLLFSGLYLFLLYVQSKITLKQLVILYVLVFIGCILLIQMLKYVKRQRYLKSSLYDLDRLQGKEFEEYLASIFASRGYRARLTPDSNDYGADLILKKEGETIVVQAKRYRNQVGIEAVQQVIGAKGYYRADKALVVTNSYFTTQAKNLARANSVELWDRDRLQAIQRVVTNG